MTFRLTPCLGLTQRDARIVRPRPILERSRQDVLDLHLCDVVPQDVRLARRWIDEEPQNHNRL